MGGMGGGGAADHSHYSIVIASPGLTAAAWDNGASDKFKTPGLGFGYILNWNSTDRVFDFIREDSAVSEVGTKDSDTCTAAKLITLTWPTGIAYGDVALLITCGHEAVGSNRADPDGIDMTDFTLLQSSAGSDGKYLQLWTKTCDGTESGNLRVDFIDNSEHGAGVVVYRARKTGADTDKTPNTTSSTSSSISTELDNSLVVRAGICDSATPATWSATGSGTSLFSLASAAGANAWKMEATYQIQVTAGSTGTETWTATQNINVLSVVEIVRQGTINLINPSVEAVVLSANQGLFAECVKTPDGIYIVTSRDCDASAFTFTTPS